MKRTGQDGMQGHQDAAAGMRRIPFSDAIVFKEVMRDPGICKGVAERALGVEIERIEEHAVEDAIDIHPDAHGVQLDAYLKADGRMIDIEMQAVARPALLRRMRFYQALMDLSGLPRGAREYDLLPDSAIVFLCLFDPLGLGAPRYEAGPCVRNLEGRPAADDGTSWVLLNASAWESEPDPGLKSLLSYAINGRGIGGDPLVERIDEAVEEINHDRRMTGMLVGGLIDYNEITNADIAAWKREGMREGIEQGRAEGRAEGEARGRAEGIEQGRAEGEARGRAEGRAELSARLLGLGVDPDIIRKACEEG